MNAIQFDASTFFFVSLDIHLRAQNRDRDFFSRSRFYSVKYADLLVKQERKNSRSFSWADQTYERMNEWARDAFYTVKINILNLQRCPNAIKNQRRVESYQQNQIVCVVEFNGRCSGWCDHISRVPYVKFTL